MGEEPTVPNEVQEPGVKNPIKKLFGKKGQKASKLGGKQKKKPKEKEKPEESYETQITGKYLLRDMPFFKVEMFLYFALLICGVGAWYLEYREVLIGITRPFVLVAVIVPIAIWFLKWYMFMPRKNRIPGMKIYKSGIIELGIYDIGRGFIQFGSGENAQKKFLTKVNKHVEASSGRPFIAVSELEGENLNLLRTEKPDLRSEEFNAILEMNTAVTTKNVMKRMLRFSTPGLGNPMMILQMMTLALMGVILAFEFGFIGGGV